MDARGETLLSSWLSGLPEERRASLYLLLDEICSGLDVSRHNRFGFLRLRAEFETSGELFGCTLEELREAIAASLGDRIPKRDRQPSALEELRDRVASGGHPDFRLAKDNPVSGAQGSTPGGLSPGGSYLNFVVAAPVWEPSMQGTEVQTNARIFP